MQNRLVQLLLAVWALCLSNFAIAAVEISPNAKQALSLNNYAQVLEQSPSIDIQRLLTSGESLAWRKDHSVLESYSVAPLKVWIKLDFSNASGQDLKRVLHISGEAKGHVAAYLTQDSRILEQWQVGATQSYYERPIAHPSVLIPLDFPKRSNTSLYLKIDSRGLVELPLTLMTTEQAIEHTTNKDMLQLLQIGGLLALGIFSAFMSASTRSYAYGYFSAQNLTLALVLASLYGYGFHFLWPDSYTFQQMSIGLFLPMLLLFGTLFCEKVLQLKYYNPGLIKITRSLAGFFAFVILYHAVTPSHWHVWSELLASTLYWMAMFAIGLSQLRQNNEYAKPYLLSWLLVILGCCVSLAQRQFEMGALLGSLPVVMGMTGQAIIQSALLAERYHKERLDKQLAQQRALEREASQRQAHEVKLKAQAIAQQDLEQKVQERTLELEFALRELNDVNRQLQQQSTIDTLTGVANRHAFEHKLEAEGRISRRQQSPIAVIMLDLDFFKEINDQFGHLAGDKALVRVAEAIQSQLKRPTDLASRYGGEEFALILPNTPIEGAKQVAESVRKAIESLPIHWDGNRIKLSVSIGLTSAVIDDDIQPRDLLQLADQALYKAKAAGRNQVVITSPQSAVATP
ncbi:sensor domain-containing diguanylate cyclase [Paraferrimonas sedimenticola]|uniref:diguanylate cyclase n=1 Tax=Paraferrimonas sedimenticola TaxID=375674 RepID=A0AA37RYE8_9GAMM|nr:diguanylate cyclase [Paraferrimonas sedimenticola]GLP97441.1 deoxynucleoside kinase [Paraferrimonas sedimenticola]